MPKLWTQTIDEHRRAVRDAVIATAATLVERDGLRAVTMSQIAEESGIGRATLYKYFPDVESILATWHERKINEHLAQLEQARDQAAPGDRLEAVLQEYALVARQSGGHQDRELAALLHRGEQVVRAQYRLRALIRELIEAAVEAGEARSDVASDELARYCIHALGAAASLSSRAAVHRLVAVTLSGLRPAKRSAIAIDR